MIVLMLMKSPAQTSTQMRIAKDKHCSSLLQPEAFVEFNKSGFKKGVDKSTATQVIRRHEHVS